MLDTLTLDRMVAALHDGHHFLCASEKQRDLWLGMLLAERLIPPDVYDRDPGLRSILDVVPFGVPSAAAAPNRRRRAAGRFGISAEQS